MKNIAFIPGILIILFSLNSCCSSCFMGGKLCNKGGGAAAGCPEGYYEEQTTEWVEEEVYVHSGAKGGIVGTKTVRHPVVKIKCKRIKCAKCGSWYHPDSGCCGTVGPEVLKRATAQGGTGEPHIGLIPTMKVLAP